MPFVNLSFIPFPWAGPRCAGKRKVGGSRALTGKCGSRSGMGRRRREGSRSPRWAGLAVEGLLHVLEMQEGL